MKRSMLFSGHDLKVFGPIVQLILVDVMYNLPCLKFSSEDAFHNGSVFARIAMMFR